jgi:hypothetical protein
MRPLVVIGIFFGILVVVFLNWAMRVATEERDPSLLVRPGKAGESRAPWERVFGRSSPSNLTARGPGASSAPRSSPVPVRIRTEPFRLQGIFYNSTEPHALINGQMVSVGGRISNATVVAISSAQVILVARGRTNILTAP